MIKRISFDELGNILEIEFGSEGVTLERINSVLETLGLRKKSTPVVVTHGVVIPDNERN